MIELLRFASESFGNGLITVLFLAFIGFVSICIVQSFKPVTITYITNVLEKETIEEHYGNNEN